MSFRFWLMLAGVLSHLVTDVRGQGADLRAEMRWRLRPEWTELERAWEARDEAGMLRLIAATPELARVFRPRSGTLIGWAAAGNATNLLAHLLRSGLPERRGPDRAFPPPLLEAAQAGWVGSVRLLLAAGADPNGDPRGEGTPLESLVRGWVWSGPRVGQELKVTASDAERHEALRSLLEAGANLFAPTGDADTNSVTRRLREAPSWLLACLLTNAVPERQISDRGDTLLHAAAQLGLGEGVDMLIARGALVHLTNGLGWTPLHSVAATLPGLTGGWPGYPPWESLEWTSGYSLPAETRTAVAARLVHHGAQYDVLSAAGLGARTELAAMLQRSPDLVRARDARGRTPLHWAALGNQVDAVDALCAAGADAGAVDVEGNTALHLALLRWPSEVAQFLMRRRVALDVPNLQGLTPLGVAAHNPPALRELLSAGARVDPEGTEPPLIRAVDLATREGYSLTFGGSPAGARGGAYWVPPGFISVRHLLAAGASVDRRDRLGRSPMEIACASGSLNLMECLAQHGADLNRTNDLGVPAWQGVLGQPSLLPYAEEPSLAYRVISPLPVPLAGLLQRVGVAPSIPQVRPESPLRLLRALGADWAATNGLGQTALHQVLLVRRARRAEVPVGFWGPPTATPGTVGQELVNPYLSGVRLLIDAGVSLEARDQRGETPWLLAWRLIDTDVAHLLFQAGADTRAVNAEGMNALHLVCFDDVPKGDATNLVPRFLGPVIPHLVRQGVNPRATDAQGRTPLHFAVALRHPLFVAVELVEAGADPRARDHQGRTPLAMAEALGRSDLVAYFLDPAGAHPFPEPTFRAP